MEPLYKQFRAKVRDLGNSKGIIIPALVAKEHSIKKGDTVVLQVIDAICRILTEKGMGGLALDA